MTPSLQEKRRAALERGINRGHRFLAHGADTSLMISRGRLGIFLGALIVCFILYNAGWFYTGNAVFLIAGLGFLIIVSYHNSLERRLHRLRLWVMIKQHQLARFHLNWSDLPPPHTVSVLDHPYAYDLDILGNHSLLHLIDATISLQGRVRLQEWFLHQNDEGFSLSTWSCRQALVKELAGLPSLRDRMMLEVQLIGKDALDGEGILALLRNPVVFPNLSLVLSIAAILCTGTVFLVLWFFLMGGPGYWVLPLVAYAALYFLTAGYMAPVFSRVHTLHDELEKFLAVVKLLTNRKMDLSPNLRTLTQPLMKEGTHPLQAINALSRICYGLSVKAHPLVHLLLNAVVPWDMWFAYRLKIECGRIESRFPIWLDRLAILDAVSSLGGFAWGNPHYIWPVFHDQKDSCPAFNIEGHDLGHPLIPPSRRVLNPFLLSGEGSVILVTGSNMSGKSTYLRTVGMNMCLAKAGAPVCASSFSSTWMKIMCCIRISDSLDEGLSYFYAEVKRLKQILSAVEDPQSVPVLCLIDEIFKGTNNRERLLGSQEFVRMLAQGKGMGMITTHDLELAQLEKELSSVRNVHFAETVEGSELRFDYRVRPGPCPTTNALRIMELEGLPIPKRTKTMESG